MFNSLDRFVCAYPMVAWFTLLGESHGIQLCRPLLVFKSINSRWPVECPQCARDWLAQENTYKFRFHGAATDALLKPFRSTVRMKGVIHCGFHCRFANVLPAILAFPDVQYCQIYGGIAALTDVELHILTACKQLSTITMSCFRNVTAMGLLAVFQRCPSSAVSGYPAVDC